MVGVGDEALILRWQVAHDGVVALFQSALDGFVSCFLLLASCPLFGHDGCVDDETEPVPSDKADAFLARQDIEAAVNRDGNNGQAQFVGQLEGSSAELRHVSGEASCPLRENH